MLLNASKQIAMAGFNALLDTSQVILETINQASYLTSANEK